MTATTTTSTTRTLPTDTTDSPVITRENIAGIIERIGIPAMIAARGDAEDFRQEVALNLLSKRIGKPLITSIMWAKQDAVAAMYRREYRRRGEWATPEAEIPDEDILVDDDQPACPFLDEATSSDTLDEVEAVIMREVEAPADRDRARQVWLGGVRAADLARMHGITQAAISRSICRAREQAADQIRSLILGSMN